MQQSYLVRAGASLALIAMLAACEGEPGDNLYDETADAVDQVDPTDQTAMAPDTAAAGDRVADIAGNPQQFMGRTVTVVADVDEVKSPFAFTLDEDDALEGGIDNDLLVLSPQSANLTQLDDQWTDNKVRVTGTVRIMSVEELEREIGWDLDEAIRSELTENRPVLIASSIERVQQ